MIIGARRLDGGSRFFLTIVIAAVLWLYWPFLQTLVAAWRSDDNYSHGFFIPVVTLCMIFSRRIELRRVSPAPNDGGLLLIIVGLLLLIVGKVGAEFFTQRFSLIVVLMGIVLFLCGGGYFKNLFWPLLYLVFMIPLPAVIWNKIAFPMQLFGSILTERLVAFLGIPVYREGNVLHLAQTTLEVVAACSGLRSLVTMFALAGAMAFFSSLTHGRKVLLFLVAAPIAIVANISRLTITAILASRYGSEVAQGFLHDFSGIVIFVLGLFFLALVNTILAK